MSDQMRWMSTKDAAEFLGVTLRSLYRFIDEGSLRAYKFGRVIRLTQGDVEAFIESCRIEPGSLEHLYPELKGATAGPRTEPGEAAGSGETGAAG